MKKINFKNLPDTSTPLSAENMNLLQNNIEESTVEVGSTQPTNKQAVWFKYSNNLFDKTKAELNKGISVSDGKVFNSASQNATDFIYVNGFDYISTNCSSYSKESPGSFYGAFYDNNKKYAGRAEGKGKTTIKVPENAVYVRLTFVKELTDSLMINKGDKLLPYDPYIVNKEMYTYNGSGYDKFSVIESGSNENGSYIKFDDGTMICHNDVRKKITTQYGTTVGGFSSGDFNLKDKPFPVKFVNVPTVTLVNTEPSSMVIIPAVGTSETNISYTQFFALADKGTVFDVILSYIAIGRWK